MHSMPSYRVSTVGNLLASPLNFSVAPDVRRAAAVRAPVPARAVFARLGAAPAAPATAAPIPITCRRDKLSAIALHSSWAGAAHPPAGFGWLDGTGVPDRRRTGQGSPGTAAAGR